MQCKMDTSKIQIWGRDWRHVLFQLSFFSFTSSWGGLLPLPAVLTQVYKFNHPFGWEVAHRSCLSPSPLHHTAPTAGASLLSWSTWCSRILWLNHFFFLKKKGKKQTLGKGEGIGDGQLKQAGSSNIFRRHSWSQKRSIPIPHANQVHFALRQEQEHVHGSPIVA